jgi:hypothetical protein
MVKFIMFTSIKNKNKKEIYRVGSALIDEDREVCVE